MEKDWVGGHAQILKWTAIGATKGEGFYWWYGRREKRDNNIKEESSRWIWFWYDDRFWLTKPQKRHKLWQKKTGHLNWQSKIRWKEDYGSGFHSFEGFREKIFQITIFERTALIADRIVLDYEISSISNQVFKLHRWLFNFDLIESWIKRQCN